MFENSGKFWAVCGSGDGEFFGELRWTGWGIYTEVDPTSPLFLAAKDHHNAHSKRGHTGYGIFRTREDMDGRESIFDQLAVGLVAVGTSGFEGNMYKNKLW